MNKETTIKDLAFESLFTDKEWSERKRHIATLKNFAGASVAAAKALAAIRDGKLYRPHKTLKEFCQRECGFTEQRLFQIIKFAKVRDALPEKTKQLLSRESQARALSSVPEDQRAEVLDDAARFHSKDGQITAEAIVISAKTKQLAEDCLDDNGTAIPPQARIIWDRRDEAKEVMSVLRKAKRVINALSDSDLMWVEVSLQGVIADLAAAISRFSSAIPAYVCPYCRGTKDFKLDVCRCCKGRGVISKFMWDHAVPEEMKR